MPHKTIAKLIAATFFVFWLFVLWLGADHPVPPGFVIIGLIDAAAALLVYWRIPTYLQWNNDQLSLRLVRILGEGLAAGVVIGLFMILLPGGGEPSIPQPRFFDNLVWFIIMGFMGMFNSTIVYALSTVIERITKTPLRIPGRKTSKK